MTVPLTGAGGFFTRAGHIGGVIGVGTSLTNPDINSYSGTTMLAKIDQIASDFAASPDNRPLIDLIFTNLSSWQSAQLGFLQQMQQLLSNTLITMANQDVPLSSLTVQNAMSLLISQMAATVDSVKSSVTGIGGQTAVGSPNGNPIIFLSATDAKGQPMQYLLPETITFTCVADAQSGAQLNQERVAYAGAAAVGNTLSSAWPGGSGCAGQMTAVDAGLNVSGGTVVYNGGFELFTVANTPDNWPIITGAAGTTVFSSATAYYGTKSLKFTGDGGGTLIKVQQEFAQNSGGSTYTLLPNTVYAVKCWVQVPVVPAAGVLTIDLSDGTSVVNDDAGTPNKVDSTLSTFTGATWQSVGTVFRTPKVMPTNSYIRIRLSTAIDSGKSVLIDRLSMSPMTQLYTGGPYATVVSASSPMIRGDQWTFAVSNTWGLFQKLFERVFGMRNLGLTLPNAGSPTVSDSLIA